jgi:uncharacterized membrane protein
MLQAHTVYIPKIVTVYNITGNDTSAPMGTTEAVVAPVELVRTIQYR